MRGQRLWHTLRLYTILGARKRAQYCKNHHIFHSMGENCSIMDRKVPLYAKLISFGNNVRLASDVLFLTHDGTHRVLNKMDQLIADRGGRKYDEKIGCIEIGNNVFIGSRTCIASNVRIGSNVIIGACSLVNKDIPDNCVVAGIPAKIIKTFDEYLEKREQGEIIADSAMEVISPEEEKRIWDKFYKERE